MPDFKLDRAKDVFEKINCHYCGVLMGYGTGDLYYLDYPACPICFEKGIDPLA